MNRQPSEKLAPEVRVLLHRHDSVQRRAKATGPSEQSESSAASERTTLFVTFQGELAALEAMGFNVVNNIGNIAIGNIAVDQILALAASESVIQIAQPAPPRLTLDKSVPDTRATLVWTRNGATFSGFTGKGVVVGIIDTGIEYLHRAFRRSDGTTRISAIWDQTLSAEAGESSPGPVNHATIGNALLGYGVEYKDQDANPAVKTINRALQAAEPHTVVRHKDKDGHGTHVAGIAAGNGAQQGNCEDPFTYVGVAPEADLIVVRKRGLTEGDPPQTGSELFDAIKYIVNRANGRSIVINMSFGSNLGPRDGSGPQEQAIDLLIHNLPNGFAIVNSAGNSAKDKIHAAGTVAGNSTFDLTFNVAAGTNKVVSVEVYFATGPLDAAVKQPGDDALSGFATAAAALAPIPLASDSGKAHLEVTGTVLRLDLVPKNSDSNLPAGVWTLRLRKTSGTSVLFNAWISEEHRPQFLDHVSADSSIDRNTTAANLIIVGAHHATGKDKGKVADFSGHGPALRPPTAVAHDNIRPHLTAPGTDITAPSSEKFRHDDLIDFCRCCCCVDWYRDDQGTSMAAPHVTGTVALMLEKKKDLTFTEIRSILTTTVRTDGISGGLPNNEFGFGRLDAKAAVDAVPAPAPPPAPAPGAPPVPVLPEVVMSEDAKSRAAFDPASPVGRLLQTPAGQKWFERSKQHQDEVRTLINTNKRVATVWHRNHGPLLGHHLTRCYLLPHLSMPNEVNGLLVATALTNMAAILQRYGSRELSRAIDEALPLAHTMPGKNFEEALQFLQDQPELTHA